MNISIPKILAGLLLLMSVNANAATTINFPATDCKAVFLEQAWDLKWDHIGVTNRSATANRWVVCPINRNYKSAPQDGWSGYINYYYGNTNASTPGITCIFRDINYLGVITHTTTTTAPNPGRGIADDHQMSIPAAAHSGGEYRYWTMSCRLPPRTALRSFDLRVSPNIPATP